jgi:hypothetical protein
MTLAIICIMYLAGSSGTSMAVTGLFLGALSTTIQVIGAVKS